MSDKIEFSFPTPDQPDTKEVANPSTNLHAQLFNITTLSMQELTALEEEIKQLKISIEKREKTLHAALDQHFNYAEDVNRCKQIIADSIKKIKDKFDTALNPV